MYPRIRRNSRSTRSLRPDTITGGSGSVLGSGIVRSVAAGCPIHTRIGRVERGRTTHHHAHHASSGHGFSRAINPRAQRASLLPQAGVERSATTELPSSPSPQTAGGPITPADQRHHGCPVHRGSIAMSGAFAGCTAPPPIDRPRKHPRLDKTNPPRGGVIHPNTTPTAQNIEFREFAH